MFTKILKITTQAENVMHQSIITELFIRETKLNISAVFITRSYFQVQKDVSLNCTHFLLWKFQTKERFYKSHLIMCHILVLKALWIFTKMYSKTIFFLVIDTIFTSDTPLGFRKNLLERIH